LFFATEPNIALSAFDKTVGAGVNKHILLVVDGAGWHRSAKVEVPEAVHLETSRDITPLLTGITTG
jgi:hypothetical protein